MVVTEPMGVAVSPGLRLARAVRPARWAWALSLLVAALVLAGCGSTAAAPHRSSTLSSSTRPARPSASAPSRSAVPPAVPTTLQITALPWSLPAPLSREVVLPNGPDLEIVGGLATGDVTTDSVYRVDPLTGAVRAEAPLAVAVHDAAGVVLNGSRYVFGGGNANSVATVQRLSGAGPAQVSGQLPSARSDLVAVQAGGAAYVLGGYDGNVIASAVLKTTDGTQFSPVATLPVPVRYAAVAVVGGVIWVFGGQAADGPSSVIQRIDVNTGRVVIAGHLPATLTDASALVLGAQIYLCGGLTASGPTAAVRRFDPVTGKFTVAGRLPSAVSDAGSAVLGGIGYLVGGENPATVASVVRLQLVRAGGGTP